MANDAERRLLLVGGEGHCRSVLDSVLAAGTFERVGIVAKDAECLNALKENRLMAPYLVGTDADLERLRADGWQYAFVAMGSVGSTAIRRRLYLALTALGYKVPVIRDPSAVVSGSAHIGAGAYIGKNAVVNAGAGIGCCAIVNTGAIIEHDCAVGEFAHISPGAILCGQVTVANDAHVGAGAVVRQGLAVGAGAMIGIGSAVVKDIPDGATAYGNPCEVKGT